MRAGWISLFMLLVFFCLVGEGLNLRFLTRPLSSTRRHHNIRQSSSQLNWFFSSDAFLSSASGSSSNNKESSSSSQQQQLSIEEALRLRERARTLLAEARALEVELQESKWAASATTEATATAATSSAQQRKSAKVNSMVERLFFHNQNQTVTSSSNTNGTTTTTTAAATTRQPTQAASAVAVKATAAECVAQVLRDERWSVDQVVTVLEELFERQKRASGIRSVENTAAAAASFNIGDVTNNARIMYNETEVNFMQACVDGLIEAAAILDAETSSASSPSSKMKMNRNTRWSGRAAPLLKSRWKELRRIEEEALQRQLQQQMAAGDVGGVGGVTTTNATVNEYMRRTLGLPVLGGGDDSGVAVKGRAMRRFNMSRAVMERVILVPFWVPSTLLPYMIAARATVQSDDVKAIKERVLTKTKFFCTTSETIPTAAVFRGNIRMDNPSSSSSSSSSSSVTTAIDDQRNVSAMVFEDIQRRMDAEGISNRVQLFLMPDPEWRPDQDAREPKPRPVLLALSRLVEPVDTIIVTQQQQKQQQQQSFLKTLVKRSSFGLTLLSTFAASVGFFALNPRFFSAVVDLKNLSALTVCIPIILGIWGIHAVHEFAHVIAARRYGFKIGFPIPLPSMWLGMLGCITPLRSFPANRTALFDFALSGPVSAFLVSILLLAFGALQTVHASEAALFNFPYVTVSMLKSSFLSGSVLTALAPKIMMLPLSQPVPISPLFLVGFAGTVASALNLLPIFRLDGGRACTAAMGSRFAAVASASALLFLLSLSFSSEYGGGLAFYWGMLVVLLQRRPEIPVRDDVTEVDDWRIGAWLTSLAAAFVTLAPFPGGNGGVL